MKIDHDLHVHTNISLCASPEATLEMCMEQCKRLGIKKMAITNHMWDHSVSGWEEIGRFYAVQDADYVFAIRKEIDEANKKGANFLFGCETEYSFKNRCPAISPAVAEQMEVVLVPNSHTHITMPKSFYEPHRKHAEYMIDSFWDIVKSDVAKYITAIPHPFLAVACPYDNHMLLNEIRDDEFKRCFDAAAEKGIALELNPNYIKNKSLSEIYDDPILRMFRIGKECGCKFTVATDAHSAEHFENYHLIYVLASLLDLREDDFHPIVRS